MSVPMAASPRAEMRMLVGYVLLAPFSGLVVYLTIAVPLSAGVWFLNGQPSDFAAVQMAVAAAIFAAPIATIVGAVPGVAWLIRSGRLTLRNLLVMGAALGNVPMLILAALAQLAILLGNGPSNPPPITLLKILSALSLGAWFGVCGALFFWFVSIRGTELDVRSNLRTLEPENPGT